MVRYRTSDVGVRLGSVALLRRSSEREHRSIAPVDTVAARATRLCLARARRAATTRCGCLCSQSFENEKKKIRRYKLVCAFHVASLEDGDTSTGTPCDPYACATSRGHRHRVEGDELMMTNQCEVPCGRSPMSEDLLSICPRLLRAVPVTFTTPPRSPDGEERDEQRRETMGVKETDLLEEMDLSMVECLNQVSDDRPSFTSGWWRKSAAQRAAPHRTFLRAEAGWKETLSVGHRPQSQASSGLAVGCQALPPSARVTAPTGGGPVRRDLQATPGAPSCRLPSCPPAST